MVKIFRKIRYLQGERMLASKIKTLVRNKRAHNFNSAKSIGILFDAGRIEDLQHIKNFQKFLAGPTVKIKALGFVDAEEISSDLMFLGNINIISAKDLDFFYRPSHPDALSFMSEKFDILIDLSIGQSFPIRYISCLSPASFKIGKFQADTSNHDFMIDIHSKPDVEFLIDQIKNYVSILTIS